MVWRSYCYIEAGNLLNSIHANIFYYCTENYSRTLLYSCTVCKLDKPETIPCCMRQQRWGEQNWRDAQKPDQACGYRHCSPIILWELLESFSLKRPGIVTGTFASWLVTRQLIWWAIMKSKRLKCWNSHLLYNNVNTQRRSCLTHISNYSNNLGVEYLHCFREDGNFNTSTSLIS